ncbi:MAG TPA: peptidylprolyl isomerase [Bryobacteraceae bacterium]|nr:peptidylprolyl isomerase [Bryobacteraceae bacterium]
MFDLFRSRQKAVRYMLIGLLSVVALSMVTYLIPGFGTTQSTKSNEDQTTVAQIGDTKLTAQEVVLQMQRFMQRGPLPPDMIDAYLPQMVDQMVDERAMDYEFSRQGLTVTDEEVLTALQETPGYAPFFKDGALVAKDELQQRLAQAGMTLQDLVDDMRRQLMTKKVKNIVYASIVVPDKEIEDQYRRQKERATIKYIAFPAAKFRDQVKPTPEDLHATFEAHHSEYFTPEKRSFQVVIVDQAKIEQTLKVSDAELHSAYAASMDNFRMPERVKARHILIKTQGKSDAEKKQALTKAQDLLKQLKAGADFGKLAEKNSEDSSNAPKGGDLGWFVHGQMVPEFDKAAFALNPGQLSDIVTTEFGYHIIKVEEKEKARVKPFEEVKAELEAELKKQRITEAMQKTGDDVHDALVKSPGSAAEIAKKFGVDLATVTDSTPGAPVPTLGSAPEIDNALGQMKVNDVSPVLTLPANRLVVTVLTNRTAARPAIFEEVQEKVRERVIIDKSTLIAKAKAKEAADKLRAGEDMEKVAREYKLEVSSPPEFSRLESVEGLGGANAVKDAFVKPAGTILGPLDIMGRDVIYKVVGKTDADMSGLAAEKETVRSTLRQQKAVERLNLFVDSIRTKLTAEKKLKVNTDLVLKIAAALKQRS